MAANLLAGGIGATSGHAVTTADQIYLLSAGHGVWYVGPGGTDAVAPAGWRRELPLATVGQAVTNANSGDVIVFLPNHAESISSAITISDTDLTFVSEGTGAARARFTNSGAAINMFNVTGAGCFFGNIVFPSSTGAGGTRITSSAAGLIIEDCAFECGASDTQQTIGFTTGWGNARITGTTFTCVASGSLQAIEVVNAGSRLFMEDVTFNGGSFGWTTSAFEGTAAITGLRANRINLLNGADVLLASSTTGWWIPGVCTGGNVFFGS